MVLRYQLRIKITTIEPFYVVFENTSLSLSTVPTTGLQIDTEKANTTTLLSDIFMSLIPTPRWSPVKRILSKYKLTDLGPL